MEFPSPRYLAQFLTGNISLASQVLTELLQYLPCKVEAATPGAKEEAMVELPASMASKASMESKEVATQASILARVVSMDPQGAVCTGVSLGRRDRLGGTKM